MEWEEAEKKRPGSGGKQSRTEGRNSENAVKERTLNSFPFTLWPPLLCTQQDDCECLWVQPARFFSLALRPAFLCGCYVLRLRGGSIFSWVITGEKWRRERPIGAGPRLSLWEFPGGIGGLLGFQSYFPSIVVQTGWEWMAVQVRLQVFT